MSSFEIWMSRLELPLLDWIGEVFGCKAMDTVMPILSFLGDKGLLWIAIAFVFLFSKKTRKTGLMMGAAMIMGLAVCNGIIKPLVDRMRPYELVDGYALLIEPLSDGSFPSGHALASFEAAVVLMIRDKRWGIPALIFAVAISFCRLYLYVHFPSDVLCGAIFGTGFAFLGVFAVERVLGKISEKYPAVSTW